MGAIAMRIRTRRARPAAQQMLDLIRRQGSGGAAFLPGVPLASGAHWLSGASSSPTPGALGLDGVTRATQPWLAAYVESTASTPAVVDGPVGFLSDGAGTVGPELVSNGSFLGGVTTGWVAANGATIAASTGRIRVTSNGTAWPECQQTVAGLTVGATYKVGATLLAATAGVTNAGVGMVNVNDVAIPTPGQSASLIFTATSTTHQVSVEMIGAAASGAWAEFSQISLRQVFGRHAAQNSGPNKPTMRRGLVNLLTYSGDLTNAAWGVQNGATQNAGVMSLPAIGSQWYHASTLPTGVPVTHAARLSGSGTVSLFFWNATDGNIGVKSIALTSTPTIYTTSVTLSASSYCYIGRVGTDTATTVNFGGAGNFVGNLTPAQIEAAGGIPQTTAVAASSSGGGYALQGNGSSTAMSLPGPVVGLTDDCVVIAGMRMDIPSGGGYFMGVAAAGNTATPARAGVLAVGPSNTAAAYWTSDAGTFFVSNAGVITPGTPYVMTAVQRSGVAKARINGGAWGNSVNPTGAATLNTAGLFSAQGFQAWNGLIWEPLIFKGTFTDAEIAVLERGVAALCPIPNSLRF